MNDATEILPPGATGEICVRGDLVMKGYCKAPEKTAETIVDALPRSPVGKVLKKDLRAKYWQDTGRKI